jgi:hypothetical protein
MTQRRKPIDDVLDWIRFRADTFPRRMPRLRPIDYQAIPWIGLHVEEGYRPDALRTRWDRMLPVIKECDVRSAVDIGSNSGWFPLSFSDLGIPSVGVEGDVRLVRIALYARKQTDPAAVSILAMQLTPQNVSLIPNSECTLLLSVWHHLVRDYGLEAATEMLRTIWRGTGKVLFFETAEEMPKSWRLPEMTPEPRAWLSRYLSETCNGSRLIHLGVHETVSPEKVKRERNLFAVVRDSAPSEGGLASSVVQHAPGESTTGAG